MPSNAAWTFLNRLHPQTLKCFRGQFDLDRNGEELLEALLGAEERGLDKVHLMVEGLGLRVYGFGCGL